mmetsp:Transcript_74855/g.189211  ORF Transcript_74855/g.189211 Transcript_74855/m.189211 type:complete len:366 (+) Transcript_74855:2-1099(+)
MLRECLQKILADPSAGGQPIPLSNMKRIFRSRYHLELSETSLGYAKLSELLQDPRLSDICSVRLQGHGYVVIPHQKPPPARRRAQISIADSLSPVTVNIPEDRKVMQAKSKTSSDGNKGNQRRGRPKIELTLEDIATPQPSPKARAAPGLPPPSPSAAIAEGSQTMVTTVPATPSPCSVRANSLPKLLGASRNQLVPWHVDDSCLMKGIPTITKGGTATPVTVASPAGIGGGIAAARLSGASGGALHEIGAGSPRVQAQASYVQYDRRVTVPPPPPPLAPPQPLVPSPSERETIPLASVATWHDQRPLTPSTLGNMGFMVQNTFIHANLPPPTPVNVGSNNRAHSLPRNMGSDRTTCAAPVTQPR